MSLIKKKQIFYINSDNRIIGTHSNFTFKLDNIDRNANFNQVVVLQAIIPKSYYLINNNNNTFILQEGEDLINISIPIGNYNKMSFKNIIQVLLNENSPNEFIYRILDDNLAFGPDIGKFTFSVTNNGDIQPSLNMNSDVCNQFGFNKDTVNVFNNNLLVSVKFINFSLENTLFIHSNICQNTTSDNVLQEIFTTGVPTASYIKYDCYQLEAYSKPFNNKSDSYVFYLTDENNKLIETNGVNLEITIMIYERNDIDNEIQDYIEMNKLKNQLKLIQK